MRARIGLLLVLVVGCVGAVPGAAQAAALVQIAPAGEATWPTGAPIHVSAPIGDPRVFVVERGGAVRIVKDGVLQPTPFVTVPGVDEQGERGALSIAFPWDYATTGKFYVFAINAGPQTYLRVLEYRVSAGNPDVADPASQRVVLQQQLDGATNHNGGQLAFSPTDGKLYVTIGENATPAYAQNPEELRGKVLRIDPADPDGDGPLTYTVPVDNPTWTVASGTPPTTRNVKNAVWAMGLRNPYRASFTADGRLVLADVGQGTTEEIDIGASGANFGWPTCEGTCANPAFVNPVYQYTNDSSTCAVIGGLVVRDATLTGLTGRYLFADLCERAFRTISLDGAVDHRPVGLPTAGAIYTLYSFGEDARGCVYVADGGTLYRLAATAGDPKACSQPFLPAPPATPKLQTPDPGSGTPAPGGGSPNPSPAPAPAPTAPTTPKPTTPAPVVYPKNCTRGGRISIRVTGGRVTSVRLVRGKKTKALKLRRTRGRIELSGVPKSGNAKLRISVKLKSGKTKKVDKTFRPCRA